MSVWPHGVTEQWFMVLYLLIGQWAHGNEWALRRAWPPTLILQNWATQKCTVTLLTQKKTSTLSRFVELALEICRFLQSNYTIPLRHNVVLEQQMRRQNYPERWITGGGCIWFNWDYKRFLFYNKAEEKVIKIQTGVEGASPENVWLGTELLQQPKKCCLWFMSQTIDTTIITHLSFFWWNSYLGKSVVLTFSSSTITILRLMRKHRQDYDIFEMGASVAVFLLIWTKRE